MCDYLITACTGNAYLEDCGRKGDCGLERRLSAVVNWLVHDLVIACLVYAAFYILKGATTISFSTEYLGEEVYYSVYDIAFVFRYSALALLSAAGLGVFERFVGKLFKGKRSL